MRVLFATGSPAAYMAPPQLADEQVICGPDWPDSRDADGRWVSLHAPVGQYDLSKMAARLPGDQQPDVVVCLVDASRRSLPRGLGAFKCPRVLLIADTHHLQSPLLGMLGYVTSEPYSRNVILYDRHHAGVFRSAGVKSLYWFPGLTFPHSDETVRHARKVSRVERIAFVGQAGGLHPRRSRLLAAMQNRGLPLVQKPLPQARGLAFYGESAVGFNASLNGDLNLRIFEILAAGAALVTDRLATASGLDELLGNGREYVGYGSAEELSEVVAGMLAAPTPRQSLSDAGAAWFDTRFSEAHRRNGFSALAFDGRPFSGCDLPSSAVRVFFPGDIPRLLKSVAVYEGLQELHRIQETVSVEIGDGVPADVAALSATLPRIAVKNVGSGEAVDMAVVGKETAARAIPGHAKNVWSAFHDERASSDFRLRMRSAGWACVNEKLDLYRPSLSPSASQCSGATSSRDLATVS